MRIAMLCAVGLIVPSVAFAASPIFGGFSLERGGVSSLEHSDGLQTLRTEIKKEFGGTFTSADTLTAQYLTPLTAVLLGSAKGANSAVSPLTAAEQEALYDFVLCGGTAIILVDNDTATTDLPQANQSFLAKFGATVSGTLSGNQTGSIIVPPTPPNPFITGVFGTATAFTTYMPGGDISFGGVCGGGLGEFTNGGIGIVGCEPAELGPNSGPVLIVADVQFALDTAFSSGAWSDDNRKILLNTLAIKANRCSQINKRIVGAPAGYAGSFDLRVTCSTPGGILQKDVSVSAPANLILSIPGIPSGSTCQVTESSTLPQPPSGFSWVGIPTFQPANGVFAVGREGGGTITVTNTMSACQDAQVKIIKKVVGTPVGWSGGKFAMTLACLSNGMLTDHHFEMDYPGISTAVVTGIPTGSVCTLTESALPDLGTTGYQWLPPEYSVPFGQVVCVGASGCSQEITVTNSAKLCCRTPGSGPIKQ